MSDCMTGIKKSVPSWCKGLTKETDERIAQRAALMRGIPKSEEHRRHISEGKTGRSAPWISESNKARCGENSATSKRYVVTYPDGREEMLVGIGIFCREHDLNHAALGAVALGRRNHHKHYKLRFV